MLEEFYDNEADIPAQWRHLYIKAGERFQLMSAGQVKTEEDVNRVMESLRKEREDHRSARRELNRLGGLDIDEVLTKLDRIEELEAANGGNIDEEKLGQMVQARLNTQLAPVKRELDQAKTALQEREEELSAMRQRETTRTIHDHVRKAARDSKMLDTAVDDALVLAERHLQIEDGTGRVITKDQVGVTPGVDPAVWLTELQQSRAHWWPESQGAGGRGNGGRGNGGPNPFSHEGWNMTEQGRLVREDRDRAEQLAKSAGTTIGGPKPAAKN